MLMIRVQSEKAAPYTTGIVLIVLFLLIVFETGHASVGGDAGSDSYNAGSTIQDSSAQNSGGNQVSADGSLIDSGNNGSGAKNDGGNNENATADNNTQSGETSKNSDDPASDKLKEKLPETKLAQPDKKKKNKSDDNDTSEESSAVMSVMSSSSSGAPPVPTASYGGTFSSVKIDPQINTGTASTSIPIEVPPGRKGLAPQLSLKYSSSTRNGWLGVGWMLDMGAIQRETRWGLDYDTDEDYKFVINDSSSELVRRSEWDEVNCVAYGAKFEGEFSKYCSYYPGGGADAWIVTAKNGTKYYFGRTPFSRLDDPDDPTRVFKWLLDRVEDTNGNFMRITYWKDPVNNEIYLDTIEYTGNGSLEPANTVVFERETAERDDAYDVYTTRFKVRTAYRLSKIYVYGDDNLARIYELAYEPSPSTLRSRLKSVTLMGSSGATLPSVTFTYSDAVLGFNNTALNWYVPDRDLSPGSDGFGIEAGYGTSTSATIADINGDALPERVIVYDEAVVWGHSTSGYDYPDYPLAYIYPNTGSGFSDTPLFTHSTYGLIKENGETYVNPFQYGSLINKTSFDMNGDSITDILYMGDQYDFEVFFGTGSGYATDDCNGPFRWNTPLTNSGWAKFITSWETNGSIYQDIIDMNGDGLPDRVTSNEDRSNGDYLLVYLNSGDGFNNNPVTWHTPVVINGYVRSMDDDGIYQDIIDMNGDGLPDRVTSNPGQQANVPYLLVYLNTGSGFADTAITWNTPVVNTGWKQYVRNSVKPVAPNEDSSTYQDIIDMNGDGLPDRVTSNPDRSANINHLRVYLNTGKGFSNTYITWNTPVTDSSWKQDVVSLKIKVGYYSGPEKNETYQTIMDITGDGLPDRITNPLDLSTDDYLIVYPSEGPFPDLLVEIDNGLGGKTEIDYSPSTQYENTRIPFVQHVVSEVRVTDGRTSNISTTAFNYEGGAYSAEEKEFRGFAYVESTDPKGTVTETWFLQDDIFKGRLDEQVVKDSGGNIYSHVKNTYSSGAISGTDAVFPHLDQTDTYMYDGDNSAAPRHAINRFTYDEYGNLESRYTAEEINSVMRDEKTEYMDYYYDEANWIMSLVESQYVTDGNGEVQALVWYDYYADGTGNLWMKTQWLDGKPNPVTTYENYEYGNVKTITDPGGNVTTINYETTTFTFPEEIIKTVNGSNQITTMHYNYTFGKLSDKTGPNQKTVIYNYDEFGRLKEVINPSPYGTTVYIYQQYGDPFVQNVREEALGNGPGPIHWKETYFDGLGRTYQEKSGGPGASTIIVDTVYDIKGLVDQTTYPYFSGVPQQYSIQYSYDPVDRLTMTTNPDGTYTTVDYDRGKVTYIDTNGHKKVAFKDIYERIVKIEEYFGSEADSNFSLYAETDYKYDVLDNLVNVRDAYGNETVIEYDTLSRKVSMNDPDMGLWTYQYDANGNLRFQTDAKLQTIEFQYDELNRVERKIYIDSSYPDITYTYDETSFNSIPTNGIGRLTTLTDHSGTTRFYYDAMGQVSRTDKTVGIQTYTTQTAYDALGRVEKITYPDPDLTEINYTYDDNGNIYQILSGTEPYITYDSYNALGNPEHITFNKNGVTTTYGYYDGTGENRPDRLKTIQTVNAATPETFMDIEYTYDDAGNITHIEDKIDYPGSRSWSRDYVYDELDRLIEARNDDFYGGKLIYQYDRIGNITYNCRYGYYEYNYSDKPHAVRRVMRTNGTLAAEFEYDDNGNMTNSKEYDSAGVLKPERQRTFTYNFDNMPTTIVLTGGATINSYDAFGMRVRKDFPGATNTYIGQIYEDSTMEGISKHIFAGTKRVATIKGTELYYIHTDHLQSSSVLTDEAGTFAQKSFYYPFGETKQVPFDDGYMDFKYKYTGKEYDAETGLYYYGARYYDPKLARFISADTIVPLPFYPQSFNRYSYAYNNPIVLRDLNGHCPPPPCNGQAMTATEYGSPSSAKEQNGGAVNAGQINAGDESDTTSKGANPGDPGGGPPNDPSSAVQNSGKDAGSGSTIANNQGVGNYNYNLHETLIDNDSDVTAKEGRAESTAAIAGMGKKSNSFKTFILGGITMTLDAMRTADNPKVKGFLTLGASYYLFYATKHAEPGYERGLAYLGSAYLGFEATVIYGNLAMTSFGLSGTNPIVGGFAIPAGIALGGIAIYNASFGINNLLNASTEFTRSSK